MNKIIAFECGICNDGVKRTRKGLREHIYKEHKRNAFFKGKDDVIRGDVGK